MSVPAEVLVERPHPGWEPWHQLLWQIQWVLADAAEQIHADTARQELAQARWDQMRWFAQGWRR